MLKIKNLFIDNSPYNNEQSDLIHRILEDKALNDIPKYKDLMEKFTNQELIDQRIIESFENELRKASGTFLCSLKLFYRIGERATVEGPRYCGEPQLMDGCLFCSLTQDRLKMAVNFSASVLDLKLGSYFI